MSAALRLLEACVGGQATSRDVLAVAVPYALEDWVEPELRGEDAFLEAAREAVRKARSSARRSLSDAAG